MKILSIIGTRPQIIKASAICRAVQKTRGVEHDLLLTGQHYDDNMAGNFLEELNMPPLKHHISGSRTGSMLDSIDRILQYSEYDYVLVYGDTNTTAAGAIAASRWNIPIVHIESGLRSFRRDMPEEVNRIIADNLASIKFAPTRTAVGNLMAEGMCSLLEGDIMYDNVLYFADKIKATLPKMKKKKFMLLTVHRQENRVKEKLVDIIDSVVIKAEEENMSVLFPIHPGTKRRLLNLKWSSVLSPNMTIIEPASYFEILNMMKKCEVVITDSGGLQKESFFFAKPCVVLRDETEWVEQVEHGSSILVGADKNKISKGIDKALDIRGIETTNLYGSGNAAENIINTLKSL